MASESSNSSYCSTKQNSNCETDQKCCDISEKLLVFADEAWHEVVKEKIKKEVESTCEEKLDKLAKIVAAANNAQWGHKIQGKVQCEQFKSSIKELFMSCSTEK